MNTNIYSLHGICFQSYIEIHFLEKKSNLPQVYIRKDRTPNSINSPIKKGVLFELSENELLFKLKGIANFYVKNGEEIIIDEFTENINEIIPFLLGPVFGGLLLQRRILPMHANTIYKNNKSLLISGISGIGKSTLTALLLNNGVNFFSDDISAISYSNNDALINKGLPFIKLWEDALKKLNIPLTNLEPVRTNLKKYRYYPKTLPADEKIKANALVIVKSHNMDKFELKKITGSDKFTIIKNNIYRKQFIAGKKLEMWQFNECVKLANLIDIYELTRPTKSFQPKKLIRAIEEIFNLIPTPQKGDLS